MSTPSISVTNCGNAFRRALDARSRSPSSIAPAPESSPAARLRPIFGELFEASASPYAAAHVFQRVFPECRIGTTDLGCRFDVCHTSGRRVVSIVEAVALRRRAQCRGRRTTATRRTTRTTSQTAASQLSFAPDGGTSRSEGSRRAPYPSRAVVTSTTLGFACSRFKYDCCFIESPPAHRLRWRPARSGPRPRLGATPLGRGSTGSRRLWRPFARRTVVRRPAGSLHRSGRPGTRKATTSTPGRP